MARDLVHASSTDRGRIVARVLAGSWRSALPPLDLTPEEVGLVAPILHRSGCSGLAWRRLEGTALRDAPSASLLHDGLVYHTLHVRRLERQLPVLVEALRERGVEPILGKGWAIGRQYPLAGLRPYGDLDLLIRPSQLPAARQVRADWDGIPPFTEFHTRFRQLRDRPLEDLFHRSRTVELHGVPIRVFAPEDHFRLLALHPLWHGVARPFWLCDVALLLETLPDGFDWELCMRGAGWEGEGIRCVLGLVRELLGVDLEAAGVPAPWRRHPLPGWLVPAALKALGARDHYLQAGSPEDQLLALGALLRSARLRWANPIEATARRRAPWNDLPRLPIQLADYTLRSAAFAVQVPGYLWHLVRSEGS